VYVSNSICDLKGELINNWHCLITAYLTMIKDCPPLMILLYVLPAYSILVITIILCCFSENASAQLTAHIAYQGSKAPSITTENYCLAPPNFLSSTASLSLRLPGSNWDQSSKPWLGISPVRDGSYTLTRDDIKY
jgi:hypothetical protein